MEQRFMEMALELALEAAEANEVPVGAVIVKNGEVVSSARNRRNELPDASAHAEILAIREACKRLGRWNLSDCELYVTLEPCVMCAGAIVYSRISRVYYGAKDVRFGCCGSVLNLAAEPKLNHRAEIVGGIMEEECLKPIREFFKKLREKKPF